MNTFTEYEQAALRTAPTHAAEHELQARNHDLLHASMGLVTEAAEIVDVLKKNHAYGKDIDRVNLIEELGDLLWYVPLMCRALDVRMSDVAQLNIEKLQARYPHKFTTEAALNRDLGRERAVLEGKGCECSGDCENCGKDHS